MDATEVNDNYRDEKIPAVQDAKRRRKAIGHIYRHSLHFMENRQHRRKKAAEHRQASLTDDASKPRLLILMTATGCGISYQDRNTDNNRAAGRPEPPARASGSGEGIKQYSDGTDAFETQTSDAFFGRKFWTQTIRT